MPHRKSQQPARVAEQQISAAQRRESQRRVAATRRTQAAGQGRARAEGIVLPPEPSRKHRSPSPAPQVPTLSVPALPALPQRMALDELLRGLRDLGAGGEVSVMLSPLVGREVMRRLTELKDGLRNCGIDPEGIDPVLQASVEQLTASAEQRKNLLPVVKAAVDRLRQFLENPVEEVPPPEGVPQEVWVIALEAAEMAARKEFYQTQGTIGQVLRATETLAKVDRADAQTLDSLARLRSFAGGGSDHATSHAATGSFLDLLNARATEVAVKGEAVIRVGGGGRRNGG
jgi:hypothetical protein